MSKPLIVSTPSRKPLRPSGTQERKGEIKGTALAKSALRADNTAVELDDVLDNAQAKPGAAVLA